MNTASPYDKLRPFKAFVSPTMIRSAPNFFDNTLPSVIRELLQNSRRSGATRADLRRTGNRWVYSDNGPGCMPHSLLGLGQSDWEEPVAANESPAGCGFFSLARRTPYVICPRQGWQVSLVEGHFSGLQEIVPEVYVADAGDERGLVIEFDRGSQTDIYSLGEVAKYMPIDFYVDGEKKPSRFDFMGLPPKSIGHRIVDINDEITVRVDLVPAQNMPWEACYNGLVVSLPDRDYQSFGTVDRLPISIKAAVLVRRESALPLELPQRNTMIRSEFTAALKDRIFCIGLEIAAERLKETSVSCPSIWLQARARGYTGPVLYPKFIGYHVLREGPWATADYDLEIPEDGQVYDMRNAVTLEQLESGEFQILPRYHKSLVYYIAQTTIPTVPLESASGSAYAIDLDEFFAPGLRLARLHDYVWSTATPREEEKNREDYEWRARLQQIKNRGTAWCDNAYAVATRDKGDGKVVEYEADLTGDSLDGEELYDEIRLEFYPDDEDGEDVPKITLEAPALFHLPGDRDDMSISLMVTKPWMEQMPSSFPGEVVQTAYNVRKCRERCDDDEVSYELMLCRLKAELAKFTGLTAFLQEDTLVRVEPILDDTLGKLGDKMSHVVITMRASETRRAAVLEGSTCEFVPEFSALYTFSGDHGKVVCDAAGNRPYFEKPRPETGQPTYSEYHAFDAATMVQLGLPPGQADILDACGWHDATRKIYVLPEMSHLLWASGLLEEPTMDSLPEVSQALAEAVKAGRVSPNLWSALCLARPELTTSVAGLVDGPLPGGSVQWVYPDT